MLFYGTAVCVPWAPSEQSTSETVPGFCLLFERCIRDDSQMCGVLRGVPLRTHGLLPGFPVRSHKRLIPKLLRVLLQPRKKLVQLTDMLQLSLCVAPLLCTDERENVHTCVLEVCDRPKERHEQLKQLGACILITFP